MTPEQLDAVLVAVAAAVEQGKAPPSLARELTTAISEGGALVRPGELLGTKEVAALLGVDRTTASRWKKEGYLPPHFDEPASGPLWLRPVITAFAEQHAGRADAAGRRPVRSRAPAAAQT